MTQDSLDALADSLDDTANALLRRADSIWGWRKRDRTISIAIGDTSRAFRRAAAALRARSGAK